MSLVSNSILKNSLVRCEMQCSAEEIEQKRLLALAKLASKNSPQKPNLQDVNVPPELTTTPNKPRFTFKDTTQTSRHNVKPYEKLSVQFYGKDKVITGKSVLISEERFVVEMSGFSSPAIEVFKSIPTRLYDVHTRNWNFHVKDHNELMSKLQDLRPNVIIEKLPPFVLNVVNRRKSDSVNVDLSGLDPELSAALMPFQEEGVRYGVDKNGRCLIADDMGLGKTFQALGIANYYINDWPLLIVTTSSMKNVWEETIHKYLPSVSLMDVLYMTTRKDYIRDCRILININ